MNHPERFETLITELHGRHPQFRRTTVARLVARVAARYDQARIAAFVPLLVRREALALLRYAEELVAVVDLPEHHEALLPSGMR